MATGTETHLVLPVGGMQPLRLLDIIPSLDVAPGPLRWLQGVTWEPWVYRSLRPDDVIHCGPNTLDVTPTTCETWPTQAPFRLSDAMEGDNLTSTVEASQVTLAARYVMSVSAAFAAELLSGAGSNDRSLSSEATAPASVPFGSAASPIWNVLSVLEAEIGDRMNGAVGYIHIPPGLLAQAVTTYGLQRMGPVGAWTTPAGNICISDAGYNNPPPPTGEAASADGEDWVYSSGPIWYAVSDPMLPGVGSETMNISDNSFEAYLASYGILVFDSAPVSAMLASYDVNA